MGEIEADYSSFKKKSPICISIPCEKGELSISPDEFYVRSDPVKLCREPCSNRQAGNFSMV